MARTHVDVLAVVLEVLRAAGLDAKPEPSTDDTADTPLVIVQDASPSPVRNGPEGAATTTSVALSVLCRDRILASDTADAAVAALVGGAGRYTWGSLVRARTLNLPRRVRQTDLSIDGVTQYNAMVRVIARD